MNAAWTCAGTRLSGTLVRFTGESALTKALSRASNSPPSVGLQARSCADVGHPCQPHDHHHDTVVSAPATASAPVYNSGLNNRVRQDTLGATG